MDMSEQVNFEVQSCTSHNNWKMPFSIQCFLRCSHGLLVLRLDYTQIVILDYPLLPNDILHLKYVSLYIEMSNKCK
jgi:hypothetical protein